VSRARDVVETVARALVDDPNAVSVVEGEQQGMSIVELFVAPGDLGKVIGRQGRTAAALRTLATVAGEGEGLRVKLEIREPTEPRRGA
jgi:predicted RNA-binding protein YlqC (UPF0109 family)